MYKHITMAQPTGLICHFKHNTNIYRGKKDNTVVAGIIIIIINNNN